MSGVYDHGSRGVCMTQVRVLKGESRLLCEVCLFSPAVCVCVCEKERERERG
jgi:hypothetical protein